MQDEQRPAGDPAPGQAGPSAPGAAAPDRIDPADAAGSPADAGDAASPPDILTTMAARLAAAEALVREHQESFLRAKAETDNVRKRASTDLQQARKFALESFAAELIPVRDSLEAALGVQNADVGSYRNGVELTLRQLAGVLEKFNILEINPLGEKFDPHRHQAISALPSDAAPNTVLAVMQKGYALHERVLRPAFVTVAKPPEPAAE